MKPDPELIVHRAVIKAVAAVGATETAEEAASAEGGNFGRFGRLPERLKIRQNPTLEF